MKFLKLLLLAFLFLNYSCSSETEEEVESPKKINNKLVSISYPKDTGSYMMDRTFYEYNTSGQINKISFYGNSYNVIYVSENLIELNLIKDNILNAEIKETIYINLKNNSVQNSVTHTVFKALNYTQYSKDSIAYIYKNDYPYKVNYYTKMGDKNPISNNYELIKSITLTVEDGNITKAITTEGKTTKVSTYTYDNNSHINLGEFTYEMPLGLDFKHILIHDKLGKKSTNNIVSVKNTFKTPFELVPEYKTIDYTRVLDSHNRLIEISISGKTISTHSGYPSSVSFTDKSGIFSY